MTTSTRRKATLFRHFMLTEGYFFICKYKVSKGAERLSVSTLLAFHFLQLLRLRTDRQTQHMMSGASGPPGPPDCFCYQLRKQNLVVFLFSAQTDQRANFLPSQPFSFSLYFQSTETFSTSFLKPMGPVLAFCFPHTLYQVELSDAQPARAAGAMLSTQSLLGRA